MMNKKLIKGIAILSTVGFLGTAIAPATSVFAQEKASQSVSYQTPISQQEMDKIIQETAKEILETTPRVVVKEPAQLEAQGFVSLGTKLLKYFGKSYVKKELPKKIYTKLPDILKGKLSEEKWLTVWGWVAKTCEYIVEGIVYAII
ncbi:hypothetical protein [Brevibacillus laterosporus]|uniref:hypothetical protein n=1 Tax=Brevibacillus laterosporus TaxID=1465 RepID=UPI000E6D3C3B|nr:hypothetical protein [Brevibacillus laterosporus]AYB38235.1 hypothetical protein D5F52_08095 [Brevibacillus laterosporus]MBM7111437.1 hypothetical protein [Brevibacillus laterosporus]